MELIFRPQPKHPRREPKRPKPIRRSKPIGLSKGRTKTPIKRMTHDPANFDKIELEFIYGHTPLCFISPMEKAQEFHHIFGRGGKREDRHIFSSVLNAAPLSRKLHDTCPLLNTKGFRQALYDHALKHVSYAVAKGNYAYTDVDLLFMAWVQGEGYDSDTIE